MSFFHTKNTYYSQNVHKNPLISKINEIQSLYVSQMAYKYIERINFIMARQQKVTIRLNNIESKAVREVANKNQISISEYIRNLVFAKNNPECNGVLRHPNEINNQ